jgi:hypothetical protein
MAKGWEWDQRGETNENEVGKGARERGDRWEEGQRMVTDGIKDDKGVRKRE